ncbi:MAG: hypothetical protein AABX93_00225 [Nanoarchaeota archaeon]
MNKKGELTTQQIVLLVILITSFVVILFLLFRLNLGEETAKELCRNSVITKGKSIFPANTVQLNCYRTYKCITQDGSCEGLNNPEVVNVENINQIYGEVAKEMADCWWMFGEGNVDYIGTGFAKNNYCSICSQIAFDDSLKNINEIQSGKISKDELYNYLTKNNVSGEDYTYSQYLFGTNNIEQLKQASAGKGGPSTFGTIETGKQFFVVMGITNQVSTAYWIAGAAVGTVAGAIVAITPVGWVAGVGIVGTSIIGGVVGATYTEGAIPIISGIVLKGKGVENNFLRPTVVEAESDRFKALNCQEILTYS